MKKAEIRALADLAYTTLDNHAGEAANERALQVLANAPDDPESYLLMAEVAEEDEQFDQALVWIDKGLSNFVDHAGLLLKKASLLLDGFEEIDEAFALLSLLRTRFESKGIEAIKQDPDISVVVDVYLLLNDCFRLKADFIEAFACAQIAHNLAPHDENAVLGLATAHFELGEYDKAHALLEPIDERIDAPDFFWQKAQILCAQGRFAEADASFLAAHRADKSRYHRPVRLSEHAFITAFEQALLALPREIRDFLQKTTVTILDIVPVDVVTESRGRISPLACIAINQTTAHHEMAALVVLYKKNIENLATSKVEIKDLIASALLHDLAKLAAHMGHC